MDEFIFKVAAQPDVDRHFAYVWKDGGQPIYTDVGLRRLSDEGVVPPPREVRCETPGPEWQGWIDQQWWGKHYSGPLPEVNPKMLELRDRLLSFGGHEACTPVTDPDIDLILSNGQLWFGDICILKKGAPSQCHSNASRLFEAHASRNGEGSGSRQTVTIATGYALSPDGLWRQHSWVMLRKPRSLKVIETTHPRVLYFGVAMTAAAAREFAYQN